MYSAPPQYSAPTEIAHQPTLSKQTTSKYLLFITNTTTSFTQSSTVASTQHQTIAKTLTISDLGWTVEDAKEIRASLAPFAEDWDDPAMDVYDDL